MPDVVQIFVWQHQQECIQGCSGSQWILHQDSFQAFACLHGRNPHSGGIQELWTTVKLSRNEEKRGILSPF